MDEPGWLLPVVRELKRAVTALPGLPLASAIARNVSSPA
jgi:hypothetical protein